MLRYMSLCGEIIATLICIFQFGKFNLVKYKAFLPYLAVIMLYEFGSWQHWFAIKHSNLWIVNIEITFEFIFYAFFIIAAYRGKPEKRTFTITTLACLLFTLADIVYIQGLFKLCSIAIVIQYVLLIVMVCRFFYNKMQEFDGEANLLYNPDFWVNTGLLFFCLAEFLFFASFNLAYSNKQMFAFAGLFHMLSGVANIILYSCLSISFLCFRAIKKTS